MPYYVCFFVNDLFLSSWTIIGGISFLCAFLMIVSTFVLRGWPHFPPSPSIGGSSIFFIIPVPSLPHLITLCQRSGKPPKSYPRSMALGPILQRYHRSSVQACGLYGHRLSSPHLLCPAAHVEAPSPGLCSLKKYKVDCVCVCVVCMYACV